MIRHVVMMRWKPDLDQAVRQEWLDRARSLPETIDVVRGLSAGIDVMRSGRSWDAVLIADFDSLEDVATYRDHPDHQPLIEIAASGAEEVASVDFEVPANAAP